MKQLLRRGFCPAVAVAVLVANSLMLAPPDAAAQTGASPGTVSFDSTAPQVGAALTASLSDPDGGVTNLSWQWADSSDWDGSTGTWTDITGATAASYTPVAGDVGDYLRATASYDDGQGTGQSAQAVTANAVVPATAPVITSVGPFMVVEGETAVATLTASDIDTPAGSLVWSTAGGSDSDKFTLSAAGVLSFTAAKDFENPDDADGDGVYEVSVQVSDGSHADSADLLVTLVNVIELLAAVTGPSSVSFSENAWTRVGTFTASSEADRDGVEWVIGGTDATHFSVDSPAGALRFGIAPVGSGLFVQPPDFEGPVDADGDNVYEITLVAQAGTASTPAQSVSVTVTDVDELGSLTLSTTRPRLGEEVTATLADPDGVTAGTTAWRWERALGPNVWEAITAATSAGYTPTAGDTGRFLRVTATYDDSHSSGDTATTAAYEVVRASQLTGLVATTTDSSANTARAMFPAFSSDVLHYGVGCAAAGDTMTVTATAPAGARLAVDGVQAASGAGIDVAVEAESDVEIVLTGADGSVTTYVVHCLAPGLWLASANKNPDATGVVEDLILLTLIYDRDPDRTNEPIQNIVMFDNNGVPRFHRDIGHGTWRYFRYDRVQGAGHQPGDELEYRYTYFHHTGVAEERWFVILDQQLELFDTATTVAPLETIDQHDFRVLEDGNYLMMAYEPAERDLSGLSFEHDLIPEQQPQIIQDSAVQIITADDEEVFTWNSWGIIPLEDCSQHRLFPDAYGHINSLQMWNGLIIGSFRGCSTVMAIDPNHADDHKIAWRVGRSNLTEEEWEARNAGPAPMAVVGDPAGEFCAQHAAQMLPNGHLIMFDNGVRCLINPWTGQEEGRTGGLFSRGVEYALDHTNGEAVFVREHSLHSAYQYLGAAHGHIDPLPNGDWLISWGQDIPRFGPEKIPDEAVTQADPNTGQEKFSITTSPEVQHFRAVPLHPVALAQEPQPLTAQFPTSSHTSTFNTGTTNPPTAVIAFNRPTVDFTTTTPSLTVTGATIASINPHTTAAEAANAYLITLTPHSAGTITVSLTTDHTCATGGICTADGTTLTNTPTPLILNPLPTPPTRPPPAGPPPAGPPPAGPPPTRPPPAGPAAEPPPSTDAGEPELGECPTDPSPFGDVGAGHWAAAAIDCVYGLGITAGTTSDTYTPAALVTRAQMAAFLARLWEIIE